MLRERSGIKNVKVSPFTKPSIHWQVIQNCHFSYKQIIISNLFIDHISILPFNIEKVSINAFSLKGNGSIDRHSLILMYIAHDF